MIGAMPAHVGKLLRALAAAVAWMVLVPHVAAAFTGTPAALKLVRQERAAYTSFRAVRNVRTGAVVYCPFVPEGWAYGPAPHCQTPARVVEEYDLSHGRVVRVVGEVTARGLPTLRYVLSKRGWYLTAAGLDCWASSDLAFVNPVLVEFPYPKEHLTITKRTQSTIVLEGFSARGSYREIDYIARKSLLNYRTIEISSFRHKTYRLVDHLSVLHKPSGAIKTPVCGSGRPIPLP
jgi:hypothetical protein